MSSKPDVEAPVTSQKILGTNVPDVSQVQNDPLRLWMSRVAVTTAVLATCASISSMFSSNHLNEAMIDQIRASDQWAFFQAKGVKATVLEGKIEMLPILGKPASPDDTSRFDRYKKEQEDISKDAKALQDASKDHRTRYKTLSRAATAFQIGIAVAAVALLMRKNSFWFLSMAVGAVGAVFFVLGVLPA